jgi:fructosamine-3-kinase
MFAVDPENLFPQLIEQVWGSKGAISQASVLNEQEDYLVVILDLHFPPGKVVVKLAGPAARYLCSFDRTASILKQVASSTTIRMPDVVAVDVTYQKWPWRYLILSYQDGEEWATAREKMSAAQQQGAYFQIGDAVGQLHSIRYPCFGELSPDGTIRAGKTFMAALADRANLIIKSPRSLDLFLSVLDRDRHLFKDIALASLCHEDLHRYNILFEQNRAGWQLKTILDFDKAWAGHSESDLARLNFWTGMTSPEFWAAYSRLHQIDGGFQHRQLIYQLLWCLEFAQPDAGHLADTRRICESLGIAFSGVF